MLLTKIVKTNWHPSNRKWYEDKGYIYTKKGNELEVKVEDLSKGSNVEITFLCDYCNENKVTIPYYNYFKRKSNEIIHKDCCKKCQGLKLTESSMEQYGVNSVFQLEEIKEKSKTTLIEKYGVDNYTKTDEYKVKTKKTNNIKYGFDHPTQNQQIKDKRNITVNQKYGTDNVFQNEEIKQKSKETCQEKYGVDYAMQNKVMKEKACQTNIIKYGGRSPASNEEIKEKIKKTNLKRYGFESALSNPIVQEKIHKTIRRKYGVNYITQNKEIRAKIAETLNKNNSCPTSSQQLEIYNMLKENNYNVELNYPLSRINLDIAIFIDNIKIDLEYDCAHWHKDQQKDRKRDEFTKSQGWKILRIRSGHKLPTLEQLEESIDKLINSDRTFTQIILDDWRDEEVG